MKCRTCLTSFTKNGMIPLDKELSIGMTIKGMLLLFIPGMIEYKTVKDFICSDCMRVIQQFLNFIEKLIVVEERLRSEQLTVVEPFRQKRYYANIDKLIGNSHNNAKSLATITKVGSTKGTEKIVVEKGTDFSHTILTDWQNNQKHHNSGIVSKPNYITTEEHQTNKIFHPTKNSKQLSTKSIANLNNQDPREKLPEMKEIVIEQKDLETNLTQLPYGIKTPLIILDELSSDATLTADEISNQSGVTLDDIEEVPPPAILSTDNKEASTKNSYITTIGPSMVSPDTVKEHDRVISITTTNQAIADLLKSLSQSKNYLPWQSPSKNKRILFLGNTLPYPRCPLCQVRLFSKSGVKVHFWQVHPNEAYPEEDDDLLYFKLDKPVKLKPLYTCPVCIEDFHTNQLLHKHINLNHKDYCRFTCDKCGRKFKEEITYKSHMKNWERYQNCDVTCEICKEVLSTDIRLIRSHYEAHKNFQCIICRRKFFTENDYKEHIATHRITTSKKTEGKKEVLCPVCGKLFLNNSSLESHMGSHVQDRAHMCDKCAKTFKTAASLKHHLEGVHVEGKNYQCTTCGKVTKTYRNLRRHKNLKHSDTYKHVCQICGAKFVRGEYYKRHLRKH